MGAPFDVRRDHCGALAYGSATSGPRRGTTTCRRSQV
jgi:hypothetical protein